MMGAFEDCDGVAMVKTSINGRWDLFLPAYRAARPEWPHWEQERLASMNAHIGPGDVVYDIGAEEGDFPALWASWGADVVLFEPNERVWPNIRAIFESNGLTGHFKGGLEGFCGAYEDRRGVSAPLTEWPACAYGPMIGDHAFCQLNQSPEIPSVAIDDWHLLGLPRPTVITMDVEGSEYNVLRGARDTLVMHRPLVWVSIHEDFCRDQYGVREPTMAINRFMASCGYAGKHLATDHEAHWFYLPNEELV